jgi:N-methylhydantoinase A
MKLSKSLNISYEQIAKQIIDISVTKIADYVVPMIKEYKLNKNRIVVIRGGCGASVLVPRLSQKLGFQYKKAEHADIISSIGVATGMIYEERERTVSNPTSDNLTDLVNEAKNEALLKNASPESLSVQSEYLNERSILRVTVIGNIVLDLAGINAKEIGQNELIKIANELCNTKENVILEHTVGNYYIFSNIYQQKKLLFKTKKQSIIVLDKFGRVRVSIDNGKIIQGNSEQLKKSARYIVKFKPRFKYLFVCSIS